jgi:hypothetical protein
MVITREVPRVLWRRTLDDLSRLHAGAPVHLTVLDDEHGLQIHGNDFRLVGLTSDGAAGSESIAAILAGDAHVTHIIDHPRSLHVELLWESRTANVQIADRDGRRTLICLGAPVLQGALKTRSAGRTTGGPLAKRSDVQPAEPWIPEQKSVDVGGAVVK